MNGSSTGQAALQPISTKLDRGQGAESPRRFHFIRAALIGMCAGLLAVTFRRALAAAESGRSDLLDVLHQYPWWGWIVLPAIGLVAGCLVGWATQRFAPEAAGSGIPHLKAVLLHARKLSWEWLLPIKFLGGLVGVGVGLSMGREGPTVQMGAAIGRALAGPLRAPASDIPQLLSAGAGAGLAAAFNAPLAGLVFVVEELHRELSSRTAAGALTAAVCATVVTQWLAGNTPSFEIHGLASMPLQALPLAAIVGVLGGSAGVVLNRALLRGQTIALRQQRIPRWAMPGIAGVLVGVIAWWLPEAVGGGHGVAERVLNGTMIASLGFFAVLIVTKFCLTVISYSSGAPGGLFAPMLLLGALLGAAVGKVVEMATPAMSEHGQVLTVLGMAAVFVGSVRAPLTGIVLISEMTDGYQLLFPICIASLAAYLSAEGLRGAPIYDALLEADLRRSGHGSPQHEPRAICVGVQFGSLVAGKMIMKAGLPQGCLVVAVERNGGNLLPAADMLLLPGDQVTVLVPGDKPEVSLDVIRLCRRT